MEHDLFGKPVSTFPDHAQSEFATIPVLQRITSCCAAPGIRDRVEPAKPRLFVYILANRPRGVLYVGVDLTDQLILL
jgi:hypothetical protein